MANTQNANRNQAGKPDTSKPGAQTFLQVFDGTDWPLLREQKRVLLSLAAINPPRVRKGEAEALDGLINWMDSIQDAAHAEGYPVAFLGEEDDAAEEPLTTDERFARVIVAPVRPYTTPILCSVESLKASILAVVEYNWNDELADYQADENESRDVHIFNHLAALDNWARGTSYTPKSYLELPNGA